MMSKLLPATIFLVILGLSSAVPQLGIKTRYPPQSGNLIHNNTAPVYSNTGNRQYDFMNRTRTEMAAGICFKEVPTVTLADSEGHAGNGSDPSLSLIQVCCTGYERNMHNFFKCDPICTTECINSLCIAPEVCKCYPDHINNLAGYCVPTCPIGCSNGDCVANGKCECKPGFVLDTRGKFCVPKCEGGCLNGNCTAPDTCVCNEGYEFNNDRKCVAVCKKGCFNGECIAPNVCSCKPGYLKTEIGCEAICIRGCVNGACTAPEVCTCSSGWTSDATNTGCVPGCDKECLNGICSGPNTCKCNRGYILDEFSSYRCVAHCPNGCPNGVCSGPNMCLCNSGFVKDRSIKGSQACIKRL